MDIKYKMPIILNIIHVAATNPAKTTKAKINNTVAYLDGTCKCFKHNVGILLAIITPLKTKNTLTKTGFLKNSICCFVTDYKVPRIVEGGAAAHQGTSLGYA